jgi:hypothetical protein
MKIVALSHGYPPLWNMGGEVSLHRTMKAVPGKSFVLTKTEKPYTFEGIKVSNINIPDVLNVNSNPLPIAEQLKELGATAVIGQNELSLPAVKAAELLKIPSIVSVHTPPLYGNNIKSAVVSADYAIYNTKTSAEEWGEPSGLVIHPPISPLPEKVSNSGDAYTVLSSLLNKGVEVVLELAKRYPDKRFMIVRSPAEPTHGLSNLEELAAKLPNVELLPRVSPEEVHKYLEQTRILLVPSRYETYGMSAIEAAGYGIPCVHVDTPHVREGIGDGAILVPPLDANATQSGIEMIEKNYDLYSLNARKRAEWLLVRQEIEDYQFSEFIKNLKPLSKEEKNIRGHSITKALRSR